MLRELQGMNHMYNITLTWPSHLRHLRSVFVWKFREVTWPEYAQLYTRQGAPAAIINRRDSTRSRLDL
jgi:hypothetical protein